MPCSRAPRHRALRLTALVGVLTASVVASPVTAGAMAAAPIPAAHSHALFVYGHSWTTGYGLRKGSRSYPALVAAHFGMRLHGRGVNGSLVHEAEERLYGTGGARWRTPTAGTVVIQANLNTLRDHGRSRLAIETSRNALRTMVATVNASARVSESSRTFRYSRGWTRRRLTVASGGYVRTASSKAAYVDVTVRAGEYLAFRGVSGNGVSVIVRDVTAGVTVTHLHTGHAVHPDYDSHGGIPIVYRVPAAQDGHVLRLRKTYGAGRFVIDGALPQRRSLAPVVLVKEAYLTHYGSSREFRHGSDAAVDNFNRVVDKVAAEFPNVRVADPRAAGWNRRFDLQRDHVHPNRAGTKVLARAVEKVL